MLRNISRQASNLDWYFGIRLEDNIKMDLQEVGWGGMDWIDLAGDMDSWRRVWML
jgi:hypothetical protein